MGVAKIVTKGSLLNQDVWKKWTEEKDEIAGNLIIEHYMYLVNYHVDRFAYSVPRTVSREDLKSFALMGLLDAVNKFDLERNLKFDTYASFRIHGSIVDGLRKEDWLPRSLREKAKQVAEITQQLEQELHRPPKAEEIATKLGIDAAEVESIVQDTLLANVLSIDQKPAENEDEYSEGIGYLIADDNTVLPDENVSEQELKEELIQSIKQLNKNEQLVISLFYDQELTMTEIGKVINLTTSRVSQIHKRAVFKLRHLLEKIQSV